MGYKKRMRTGAAIPRRGTPAERRAPPGLRQQLEATRLGLLALFRALDRLGLAQECPPELQELFELDADLAEALWVLDQPVGRFDLTAMTHDTVGSLRAIGTATSRFLDRLNPSARAELGACALTVRARLLRSDAYLQIPGRDPTAPAPTVG